MLGQLGASLGKRLLLLIVSLMLCVAPLGGALAQIPTFPSNPPGGGISVPPGSGSGGIQLICKPPPGRCLTKEARAAWARDHNCKWPEEVCEKTSAADDSAGAKEKDKGFWGSLWDGIKSSVTYGYEFVKGVVMGLKSQIADLWNMVTNPGEIISGLVELGKSFFNDPKGTMAALGQMLGQEAVDTFTRATQCGAYDLGKVIGSYVSPVFALKLATKLTKYSGKLADATKALRAEYGCASFGAGTLVLTADGYAPIETIAVGQQVRSRNENSFGDGVQQVTDVLGRIAPSYRRLVTEFDELKITDEHPLWVQGKGWTEADKLVPGDIIASEQGDAEVVANEAVRAPLRVYNFSVANTPNYFVGTGQVWVHNARVCSIEIKTKPYRELDTFERGYRAEFQVFQKMEEAGFHPVSGSPKFKGDPQADFAAWDGQTGIDGMYKNAQGDWVIVESKASGSTKKSNPTECKAGMCKMVTDERQMSDEWIDARLSKILNDDEFLEYTAAKAAGKVKKVYAYTDGNGVTDTYSIVDINTKDVKVGQKWDPKTGIKGK